MLESHGLPVCLCGLTFVPERVELCALLGLSDAPAVAEYQRELSSVLHGQASHGRRGRQLRLAEDVAAERVEARRQEVANKRRFGGRPVPSLPF